MLSIQFDGFDWDASNVVKNLAKHGIPMPDIEHALLNRLVLNEDKAHSRVERRMAALGMDTGGRMLLVIFTLRKKQGRTLVRPISARHMHAKELKRHGIR